MSPGVSDNGSPIGILGGTFDPPHKGHLILAKNARDSLGLSRVLFIPSGDSYMKEKVSEASVRLKMTRLAVMGRKGFRVSEIEVERGGRSYSYETILTLKERFREELYFIIGEDTLFMMEKWARPEVIFKNARIACAARDKGGRALLEKSEELKERFAARISILPMEPYPCSSTRIREMIRVGESAAPYLPSRVMDYIVKNRMYTDE